MVKVKTRFAPSPTGELHIGNARTALFAYLFGKSQKGDFYLRIEDTDQSRKVKGGDLRIMESLKLLGINWDGEVYYQSQHLKEYQKAAEDLVENGDAYYCFCSKDRLDKVRKEQAAKKLPPIYDEHCRDLTQDEVKEKLNKKVPYVIRLKVPPSGKIEFDDLIRGIVSFDYSLIDDQILLKSDGWPTYHLANVVDDHKMGINYVLRADEWIASTPKHLLLYEYFGFAKPNFAHLPMILAPDKSKLSKRFGAVSILQYQKLGYLPEALINFMVLMGWSKGNEEFFDMKTLEKVFDIKHIQKSPAIFNIEKLNYLNGYYLRKMTVEELDKVLCDSYYPKTAEDTAKLTKALQSRMQRLADAKKMSKFFFADLKYQKDLLVFGKSTSAKTQKGLLKAREALDKLAEFDWLKTAILNQTLETVVKKNQLANGDVFWPVRVALSGLEQSPSPSELLWVLGKEKSMERIKAAISKIADQ
jgi:glutamyl-tRNA synthetase